MQLNLRRRERHTTYILVDRVWRSGSPWEKVVQSWGVGSHCCISSLSGGCMQAGSDGVYRGEVDLIWQRATRWDGKIVVDRRPFASFAHFRHAAAILVRW